MASESSGETTIPIGDRLDVAGGRQTGILEVREVIAWGIGIMASAVAIFLALQ